MSTEPISDEKISFIERHYPREVVCLPEEWAAVKARIRALEAEVARKDEALRQIAEPRNWEEQDRARSIARAALGPWRPTHQHSGGDFVRELSRGRKADDAAPMVAFDKSDGSQWFIYASDFDGNIRGFDRHGMFARPSRCYRPLTPAEQAAYVEAAMGERT